MIFRLFKKKVQDQRNNRVVAVIECILNQNARDPGAATYPLKAIIIEDSDCIVFQT